MVSSAYYPRLDPENRAMFSKAIVTDLLRGRLGYDGVVITDDVGAAQAVADVPVGQRATRFIAAGGDIVLTVNAARRRRCSRPSPPGRRRARPSPPRCGQRRPGWSASRPDLGLASCAS